ncbi:MAG: hypothetical protein CMN30_04385 [Sandaracinus sp.]|nr:hypothetical protein [Sandaracinus sp.]|tara:strand:+ start:1585 stop:2493 length:909 start_codon:yes stop_codon:yes gene_type:complete
MTNRAALLLLPSLALVLPALAEAQCPDGATFCAEIEVEGSVSFGRPPPPPPPVEVEVEVQAPPPPVAQVQVRHRRRRGRVVVVRPAPQAPPPNQVVVVQAEPPPPPPQQTTVTVQTQRPVAVRRQQRWNRKVGLTGRFGGMFTDRVAMGGFQLGARFRPSRIFGVELGIGAYGGEDYDGNARREHPLTFDFMFFFPRASRFQVYTLVGGGFSFARVDTDGRWDDDWDDGSYDERYAYIGGQLGLGFEWRISPVFALSADVRGFLRTRIDGDRDTNPEFVARDGRTTNTSAGALGTLGMHFYF